MKKMCIKACAGALAVLIAFGASGCDKGTEDNVMTCDTPVQSVVSQVEEPDIGEHRDYHLQTAKCFMSNDILIANHEDKSRAMRIFDNSLSLCEFYGSELNTVKERLGAKYHVYSMIVPSACEFYAPSNMRMHITSMSDIDSYLKDIFVNVTPVDVTTTLRNHNAENIYFNTDGHCTGLGAYYAGRAFAKNAGVEYADISQYTPMVISDSFIGNYQESVDNEGQAVLEQYPDEFIYYKPKAKFTTYYYDEEFDYLTEGAFFEEVEDNLIDSYFKGGYYCLKLATSVKNDRRLIIIKDTMSTPLAAFFTSSYEEIYVVDINYLNANLIEMIEDFKITDVLYALSAYTVTSTDVYGLETLRTQASHGALEDNAPESTDSDISSTAVQNEDTDTEASSEVEVVYDVGVNNPIGVMVDSELIDIEEYYQNPNAYITAEESAADFEEDLLGEDDEYYPQIEEY